VRKCSLDSRQCSAPGVTLAATLTLHLDFKARNKLSALTIVAERIRPATVAYFDDKPRAAFESARCASCSTTRIVMPFWRIFAKIFINSSTTTGARPRLISSIISNRGEAISARHRAHLMGSYLGTPVGRGSS
jgi:hypothetical protein